MFWLLFQHLLLTTALAVVVLGLCKLFAARASVCHAFWLIVLCKFLLPPMCFWPWSFADNTPAPSRETVSLVAVKAVPTLELRDKSFRNNGSAAETSAGDQTESISRHIQDYEATNHWALGGLEMIGCSLLLIWLVGSCVSAVRSARSAIRVHCALKDASPAPLRIRELLDNVASKRDVATPRILSSDGVASPFVWSPRGLIVWPHDDSAWSDEQIQLMLAHELAHLARRDHWVALLQTIGHIVWWWNPVYCWTVANVRLWSECACDASVTQHDSSLCGTYARLLISLANVPSNGSRHSLAAIGINNSHRLFERRLTMVMNQRASRLSTTVVVCVVAFVAILAIPSLQYGQTPTPDNDNGEGTTANAWVVPQGPQDQGEVNIEDILPELFGKLDKNLLSEVDRRKLVEASLKGIAEELGDGALYQAEAVSYCQPTKGLVGIGSGISPDAQNRIVLNPLQGSPAIKAGILFQDLVVSIDGVNLESIDENKRLAKSMELLSGLPDSVVRLRVQRGKEIAEIDVQRELIEPVMKKAVYPYCRDGSDFCDTEKRIGYLRIAQITFQTVEEAIEPLNRILDSEPKGIILDLRFNSGGAIEEAAEVADLFLASGKIVEVKKRDSVETHSAATATTRKLLEEIPVAVIVNEHTASAAEVVAAALQDNGRATVVGTQTSGAGTIKGVAPLSTGGYFVYPVGHIIRSSGQPIGAGVSPNEGKQVVYSDDEAQVCRWMLYGGTPKQDFVDRQLAAAIASIDPRSEPMSTTAQ